MTIRMPHERGKLCRVIPWCIITAVLLGSTLPIASAQTNVNILLFYEEERSVQSFDQAVEYFKKNPSIGITVNKVFKVMSNGTDATGLIKSLCKDITEAIKSPESPDVVVDFTRHGIPSEAVKLLMKVMNLPTVSGTFGQEGDIRSWRELKDNMKEYLIQIAPPADMVPQAVRSIVAWQDMTSAVLLFDEQYEMYHKYKSLLQNMPTRHLLTKLEVGAEAIRRQVDRLVHVDITNFFIAASPNEISSVLAEASDPMMRDGPYFSDEYAWYSMSMEPGLPKCSGCKKNVSVIHLEPKLTGTNRRRDFFLSTGIFKTTQLMEIFYFDLTTSAILAVAKIKKEKNWVTPPKKECKDTQDFQDDYKLDLFAAISSEEVSKENILGPFYMDPDRTVGKSHAQFEMTIRRLVFDEKQAEPKSNVELGTWKTGFIERELISTSGHEEDWKAHIALTVFRIVTHVQEPFVYKYENCDDHDKNNKYSRCFKGYCIDLLIKIQEELNFNYTIRNVTGYGYMGEKSPHEWDGMVKELKDRKADIALGAMSVMAERESVVDFTVPYYDLVGISILMRKPKTQTSLFKFLTVLENDVWMCILGAYFFTSFLMWVFDRWSPYSYQNNREKYEDDEEKREFNLKECLWFCMTSLTPQGGGEAPKNLSGRLVAATWWLFGFIIIASYTANLAAFLTVSRLDAPIESLDDLAKQYKIQYAPQRDTSAWIYFDRMAHIEHRFYEIWKDMSLNDSMSDYERSQLAVWDYPVSDKFTKMWQAMQENKPPVSFQEAIERVRGKDDQTDGFAFLDEATNIRYQTIKFCEFKQVGEEFSRKPYAIAVQKGSPLKESFSHMIARKSEGKTLILPILSFWYDVNVTGDATDIRYQTLISCDFQMVGEEFSRKPYALAVQQGSPLKDQLNDAILKLLNQRHLEQLKETWWNENDEKKDCPKDDNQSDGISIHNIGGVFIVIFVGIIMACFTLVFEYWWYRKRNIAEEMAEMALPAPKEFGQTFSTEKTNFNTQYGKQPRTDLPTIENSW